LPFFISTFYIKAKRPFAYFRKKITLSQLVYHYLNLNNKAVAKADWTKSAALGNREAFFMLKASPAKHTPTPTNWVVWKK
jgi:hypothetical protein